MNFEERAELEFYILLHSLLGTNRVEERDYDLNIDDNGEVLVEFSNYNTYASAKYNQYYILTVRELKDADLTDYPFTLHFDVRPEFEKFDSKRYIENCEWYRRLFGVTIDVKLKRLIGFLLNMTNWKDGDKGLKKFLDLVERWSPETKEEIRKYVWTRLFNLEDQPVC